MSSHKTSPEDLIKAVKANEDANYCGHEIRARAFDEGFTKMIKSEISEFIDGVVTVSQTSDKKAIQYIYEVMDQWREDGNVESIQSVMIHTPIEHIPSEVLLGLLTAARWMRTPLEHEYKSLATRIRNILEHRGLEPDRVNNCMRGLE
jgi:hypothetical protein